MTASLIVLAIIAVYWFVNDFTAKRSKFRNRKEEQEREFRFDCLSIMLSSVRTDNDMELFADEVKIKLQEKDYESERYQTLFLHYTEINDLLKRIRVNDGGYIISRINFEEC